MPSPGRQDSNRVWHPVDLPEGPPHARSTGCHTTPACKICNHSALMIVWILTVTKHVQITERPQTISICNRENRR